MKKQMWIGTGFVVLVLIVVLTITILSNTQEVNPVINPQSYPEKTNEIQEYQKQDVDSLLESINSFDADLPDSDISNEINQLGEL